MKKIYIILLISIFVTSSCDRTYKKHLQFSTKDLEPEKIELHNYGSALFNLDTNSFSQSLSSIQKDYPHFLGNNPIDSNELMQLYTFVTDPWLQSLYLESTKLFPDYANLEKSLTNGFRRMHHYYPTIEIPKVYSYISGVSYENPVMTDGQAVVIGVDCYLGAEAIVYQPLGIPRYLTERMSPEYIARDVFAAMYDFYFEKEKASSTILSEMISAGKKLFFLEAMQPDLADHIQIGYSASQIEWAKANEAAVWASFVSEQMLYSGEQLLFKRLFGDGPFSQDFSNEAPPRLGEWIGWQIVRNFMENNPDICVVKLHAIHDDQEILTRSRYRPKV